MQIARELSIRGTPIHMLQDGSGPDLPVLHGAGGAGRWLPFQEHLAKRTLELMQLFAEEVMPHFREDAHVDETAGVGRQSRSVSG
jgi:hypothetical protein